MDRVRLTLVVFALACVCGGGPLGCVTVAVAEPPVSVELVVVGLREDERAELRDRVCAIDGVSDCLLADAPPVLPQKRKKRGGAPPPPSPEARVTFSYAGPLGELRARIRALPHPGLDAQRADLRLSFRGFDNKAPTIVLGAPQAGAVTAQTSIVVQVTVDAPDIAAVAIGENDAARDGALFSATVDELHEGENVIVVRATDQAGNASELSVPVVVDTTGPILELAVDVLAYDKALVRGRVKDAAAVTVDGRAVELDLFGGFEAPLAVDPDKAFVDVIATDALGNPTHIKRSVKIASPMSADSRN